MGTTNFTAVLIPLRARGGKMPQVSESPFSDTESCSQMEQRSLKELCLKREAYQCMVNGIWDRHAMHRRPKSKGETRISTYHTILYGKMGRC